MFPPARFRDDGKGRFAEQLRPLGSVEVQGAEAPGDAIPVGEITIKIMAALKALYAKEGGAHPAPILNLKWDYTDAEGRYDALKVSKQIKRLFSQGYGRRRQGSQDAVQKGTDGPDLRHAAGRRKHRQRQLDHGRKL